MMPINRVDYGACDHAAFLIAGQARISRFDAHRLLLLLADLTPAVLDELLRV